MENAAIPSALWLVYKPQGPTSFAALSWLRKALGGKSVVGKAGHTGTLDPLAEGLLVVAVNGATKLLPLLEGQDKTYIADICLDGTTESGDVATEIVPIAPEALSVAKNSLTQEHLESIIQKNFIGTIEQRPPLWSAVHVDGKRAYTLARGGMTEADMVLPARKVTIHSVEILAYTFPHLRIKTRVSAGTYIRSLGRDIGRMAWVWGYLTHLVRNGVGDFTFPFDSPQSTVKTGGFGYVPLTLKEAFPTIPQYIGNEETLKLLLRGQSVPNTWEVPVWSWVFFTREDATPACLGRVTPHGNISPVRNEIWL